MVGQSVYCLGELSRTRALFEQALTYDDPPQHCALALLYVTDPVVASHAWLSFTLWLLGCPDQAQRHNRAALSLARELGHALTLGSALAWAAFFHRLRGDGQATYKQAEPIVPLSTEQGLPLRVARGMILRGWALTALGAGEEGRVQLRQGLEGWRTTGAAISWSYYLGSLADAYARGACAGEGLVTVAEALTCVEQTGERYAEAELHRLKDELLLKQPVPDAPQAEACFQQATSWELRVALSLCRLWLRQGKCAEARELLAVVVRTAPRSPLICPIGDGRAAATRLDSQMLKSAVRIGARHESLLRGITGGRHVWPMASGILFQRSDQNAILLPGPFASIMFILRQLLFSQTSATLGG